MDGWLFGNLLFGGLICVIVDAATGAMYKLTPNQMAAQLQESTTKKITEEDKQLYFAVSLNIDPTWEKIGCMEKINQDAFDNFCCSENAYEFVVLLIEHISFGLAESRIFSSEIKRN